MGVNSSGSAKNDIQGEGLRDSPLPGPSPNEAEDGPENSLIYLKDKEGKEKSCGYLIESADDSESRVKSK